MTREEAIEIIAFEKCHCETHLNDADKAEEFYNEMRKFIEAFDMAIKALEAPPNDNWEGYSKRLWKNAYERGKAEAEQRWIPVSERLPEKNDEVLATTEWGAVTIAEMYSANDCFIHEGTTNADIDEIVAWMPLPEPYKAESEEV